MRWGAALRVALIGARSHLSTGLVLLVAVTVATTTLSLALAVRSAALSPWEATWERTRGAHVVAEGATGDVTPMRGEAGVVASSGPWPFAFVTVHRTAAGTGDTDLLLKLVGRDTFDAAVERPAVTEGAADLSGLVVERSLADALGVSVGERLTVGGRSLTVTGVAVSLAQPPFPRTVPGLAWTSTATVQALARDAALTGVQVHLRLADPGQATNFARAHGAPPVGAEAGRQGPGFSTWVETREATLAEVKTTRAVLLSVSGLLLLLTCAAVVLLVRARTAADSRRIGALKAAGFTPGEVVLALLAPHLLIALVATLVGLVGGGRLAPLLSGTLASSAGTSTVPPTTWGRAAATTVAGLVVVAAAAAPALQGVRGTTVGALVPRLGTPRARDVVGDVAAALHLPVPVLLGARSAGRNPWRSLLTTSSTGLATATVVSVLCMEATFAQEARTGRGPAPPGIDVSVLAQADAAADVRLRTLVLVCSAALLAVATLTTWGVGYFEARQGVVTGARLRAVGLTRRQAAGRLVTGQVLAGTAGALVGVPAGLLVFSLAYADANGGSDGAALPSVGWLAATIVAVVVAIGAIAAAPAARSLRGPVGPSLASE